MFGQINVRLTMSKTAIGKAYGVINTCMFTRAIHPDVAAEYSTEAFLQAFRRFTMVMGTLEVLFTNSRKQLVGANAIIQAAMRDMYHKHATGAYKDIRWEFEPGGAPWRQGCAESIKKTVK